MIRHGFYVLFWISFDLFHFIINNIAFGFLIQRIHTHIGMLTFFGFQYLLYIESKKNDNQLNGWRTRHAQTIMSVDQCPRRRRNLLVFGTCRMVNDIRRLRSIVPPS